MSEEKTTVSVNIDCPIIINDFVTFPGEKIHLQATNVNMKKAIEKALASDGQIFIVTPKDNASGISLGTDGLHEVGTLGQIIGAVVNPEDGTPLYVFKAQSRARLLDLNTAEATLSATVEPLKASETVDSELVALAEVTLQEFEDFISEFSESPEDISPLINNLYTDAKEKPYLLADNIIHYLGVSSAKEQALLEILDPKERLQKVCAEIAEVKEINEMKQRISAQVATGLDKQQKEYLLREQLKVIQKELGNDNEAEFDALEKKIKDAGMTEEAAKKCNDDLKKLRQMNPADPNANTLRNYLDWMVSVPWSQKSEVVKDLKRAEEVLEADHYGLEEVKEHILDYLAVQQRSEKVKGSIICLVGPPGVGKTSLGKSIAKATGREFLRISLGGVQNESDVRGHRRTYIGAEPGRIISNMKKAGTTNPLVQLDEIDKLSSGSNINGDPSAAMLEVLDPQQNNSFQDHYLGIDYDLSNAMFICTANDLGAIPGPLRDRMEIIHIPGYTDEEKVQIAKRHLISKQMEETGLNKSEFSISDAALNTLISDYTSEAGVRGLEHEISSLARKAVREIETGRAKSVNITPENLEKYAGAAKVSHTMADDADKIGRVNGLYVSGAGGGILPIEAVTIPTGGKGGGITMTGQLGDVMKESIKVAEMLVKSRSAEMGIQADAFDNFSVHIHAPQGATPKDGPSAGLAMVTSIVSVLTGTAVRKDVAMTGEVGLLGEALPIGGLKEKLLGALQAGIKKVMIPQDNVKDLAEVPDNVKQQLEIVPVTSVMEVLKHALVEMPAPVAAAEVKKPAESGPCSDPLHTQLQDMINGHLKSAFEQAVLTAVVQGALPKPGQPANDTAPQAAKAAAPARR